MMLNNDGCDAIEYVILPDHSKGESSSTPEHHQNSLTQTTVTAARTTQRLGPHKRTASSALRLGGPHNMCPHCALLTTHDSRLSNHFFDGIRCYNSMFTMTSMGANVIKSINDGQGPYVFKVSGQVCHRIGSLLPPNYRRPEYCQLYIFDTENEVRNRMAISSHEDGNFEPNQAIVASLVNMFNTHNPIVQLFRTARERLSNQTEDHFSVKLFSSPREHGNVYNAPTAAEVVGLVINDLGLSEKGRDLIVQDRASNLQKIEETHYKFMAMQYPLLFPYGEDGFHKNLKYRRCRRSAAVRRKNPPSHDEDILQCNLESVPIPRGMIHRVVVENLKFFHAKHWSCL